MSWLDGLADDTAIQNQRDRITLDNKPPEPGFFTGAGTAAQQGLTKGVVKIGDTLGFGIGNPMMPAGEVPTLESFKATQTQARTKYAEQIKSLTPKADEVGIAGQVLNPLFDVIPRTVLGSVVAGPFGGAVAAGAPEFTASKAVAVNEGIDPETAAKKAAIDTAVMGIGAVLPAGNFMKALLPDAALSIGANVGLGIASRAGTSQLLERNGYAQQAQQYKAFDATAITIDAVLGAAFFGASRIGRGSADIPTEVVDAALTEKASQHINVDSAPGAPVNGKSAAIHAQTIEQVLDQLAAGEPVSVKTDIADAAFIKPTKAARGVRNNNPGNIEANGTRWQGMTGDDGRFVTFETPEAGIRAMGRNLLTYQDRYGLDTVEAIISRWAPPGENNTGAYVAAVSRALNVKPGEKINLREGDRLQKLTDAIITHENGRNPYDPAVIAEGVNRALGTSSRTLAGDNMQAIISKDRTAAIEQYNKLPDSNGGRILNTDLARELSPEYRADRTKSADVHEPASQFIKDLYAEKLAQPVAEGRSPMVLFTAGGTGSGKSTGLKNAQGSALLDSADIIFDTNMNTLASAMKKIEQALDSGRDVNIAYVYRDPVEALTQGALPRAMRMGRTVPLDAHAATHEGASAVMRELAAKYANDPRVNIYAFDNTKGKGGSTLSSLDQLPIVEQNSTLEVLKNALESEYQAGNISEAVYQGTRSQYAGLQGSIGQDGPGVRQQPEPQRAGTGQPSEQVTPEQGAATAPDTQALTQNPPQDQSIADQIVTGIRSLLGADNAKAEPGTPAEIKGTSPETQAAIDAARANPDLRITLDDGTEVSAAEAVALIDSELKQANTDAQAFSAAVTCFLRTE